MSDVIFRDEEEWPNIWDYSMTLAKQNFTGSENALIFYMKRSVIIPESFGKKIKQ